MALDNEATVAYRARQQKAGKPVDVTKIQGISKEEILDAFYDTLTYDEVINNGLEVMDTAAFALARDSDLPLRVFDMSQPGELLRILQGEPIGTLVRGRG